MSEAPGRSEDGQSNDVMITGIGLVTALGIGHAANWEALVGGGSPPVDEERFAPYPVHPLPEIDWSEQIPKRGDQRQMDNWQRLGVFCAGLALEDAGLKGDEEACASIDMIVAAGGGERDVAVDAAIIEEARSSDNVEVMLNQRLSGELRPTLFLAQLSNLLAGNISIVHKVTGSSRTFMGEEGAGISAIHTAAQRIRAGQSECVLVGGAYNAERLDMLLALETGQHLHSGPFTVMSKRQNTHGGGVVMGSMGAFLVLESRQRTEQRGVGAYATLSAENGARGSREDDVLSGRLNRLVDELPMAPEAVDCILSARSGSIEAGRSEDRILEARFAGKTVYTATDFIGHGLEVQFPVALALAAMVAHHRKLPSEANGAEDARRQIIVTAFGHRRYEGFALVEPSGTEAAIGGKHDG